MERPKLIIVVGARGVGKTTVTNWLREWLLRMKRPVPVWRVVVRTVATPA